MVCSFQIAANTKAGTTSNLPKRVITRTAGEIKHRSDFHRMLDWHGRRGSAKEPKSSFFGAGFRSVECLLENQDARSSALRIQPRSSQAEDSVFVTIHADPR
jgi:hypothetical protein